MKDGKKISARNMPTHFGPVSFELHYDNSEQSVLGFVDLSKCSAPEVILHVRLPQGNKLVSLASQDGVQFNSKQETVTLKNISGKVNIHGKVK